MPTRFVFDFYGDAQVDRTLLALSAHAADARPAWNALADRFVRAERAQFGSEGAYASGVWAPLSPRYKARKEREYPGRPILERTGRLVGSLTRRPLDVEVITASTMRIGTSVPYAKFHQRGTDIMPRRRPVELPESERREWVRLIQRFIITGRPT